MGDPKSIQDLAKIFYLKSYKGYAKLRNLIILTK